jgi:hypothetical protein
MLIWLRTLTARNRRRGQCPNPKVERSSLLCEGLCGPHRRVLSGATSSYPSDTGDGFLSSEPIPTDLLAFGVP